MRVIFYLIGFILSIATREEGYGWARHNIIMSYSLNQKLKEVEFYVTDIKPDDSINPEYILVFTNPDPERNKIVCEKFVLYDLDNGLYYGFKGKEIGRKTNAFEVLVDYSDEPDWGMDKNLELSFAQRFMAGSQGYRHMYYPFWTFHIPYPFLAQGEAPDRAQHFFERAIQEYRQGRHYSAYRELARSLHYVMDMAQPFHTYQLPLEMIQPASPFNGTIQAIKNYHFAYETLVANLLQKEECEESHILIKYIMDAEPIVADNARQLAIRVAIQSHERAKKIIPECLRTLGKQFNSQRPRSLTEEEYHSLLDNNIRSREIFLLTRKSLELTSGAVRGLILLFEKEIQKEQR